MNDVYEILKQVSEGRSGEPERLAGEIHAQLHYGRIEQIVAFGLHEYLTDFLGKIGTLGNEINLQFLTPVYA
jgi:uncharacterized alpha-E superfamily protein